MTVGDHVQWIDGMRKRAGRPLSAETKPGYPGMTRIFFHDLQEWEWIPRRFDGQGLVGHAGAVLLRVLADGSGLTAALGPAFARAGKSPLVDRGVALVSMAIAIALGARSMSDIAVLGHLEPVLGAAPSDTTARRTLELADPGTLGKIAQARARARAHVRKLIEATPGGFPWLEIAGKTLTGWLVIDMDATLITAHSEKQGAAPAYKKGFGFHPLGVWLASTAECLAMLLRPGNAGSNTVADHIEVLAAAITQVRARFRRRLLAHVDGAGPATSSSITCCRRARRGGRCCSPAGG